MTSQAIVVSTTPIDQPARCRRSWQDSISAGPDLAAMISDEISRRYSVAGQLFVERDTVLRRPAITASGPVVVNTGRPILLH
jgi:hypothetical protein